jgi:hypothetical protein
MRVVEIIKKLLVRMLAGNPAHLHAMGLEQDIIIQGHWERNAGSVPSRSDRRRGPVAVEIKSNTIH